MGFQLGIGTRVRKSPYFDATVAAGVTHFSTYNHMYMPVSFGDTAREYKQLTEGVSMWDVSCQRQIQLEGPDAGRLAQAVSARDLTGTQVGQGRYVPMVDHDGRLINDPLILRVDEDRWWISIADGDILQWCRAVAGERSLDAKVTEADVSPLAVQGPLAEDVVAALVGDWARELKFFWYRSTMIEDIPLRVGRAGWSKQGGFELYLEDGSRGVDLWNLVAAAGEPFGIGPGAPNYIERIESGLLSFRADTEDDTDPFEAGLGRWVSLDSDADFIGKRALRELRSRGMRYEFKGLMFGGEPITQHEDLWPLFVDDKQVGTVRAAAYSPRLATNVAIVLVDLPHNATGSVVSVRTPSETCTATVVDLPMI